MISSERTKPIHAALLGSRGVPACYGAFEVCADKIATVSRGKDIRWTIYCPEQEGCPAVYGKANLVFVKHGKGKSAPLFYDIRSLWHASRSDADVIVMLGYGAGPFFLIPRIFGKKLIINTDGFEYLRSKWPWYVRIYFRCAEFFAAYFSNELISDSTHIVKYYEKRYKKKSTFIAYGTDVPDVSNDHASEEKMNQFLNTYTIHCRGYHVVVMRLEPENSIKEICEAALKRVAGKPVLLIGPSTPFFENSVRPLIAGSSQVIVAGPIYDRPLLYLLRCNALSYIHGHTVGGINPTLLESLSTGTPVIARRTPFNEEVLEDAGLYFHDIDSLIRQLDWVESCSIEAWHDVSQSARSKLRPCFTWNKVVEDYESLITFSYSNPPG
ncbi:MAG: DUF1972 domain-containing protein [wastewater metagenome]|nr:DUF1972 domain-containing protein [Candidatus Loosdrechtia aerotolerans]